VIARRKAVGHTKTNNGSAATFPSPLAAFSSTAAAATASEDAAKVARKEKRTAAAAAKHAVGCPEAVAAAVEDLLRPDGDGTPRPSARAAARLSRARGAEGAKGQLEACPGRDKGGEKAAAKARAERKGQIADIQRLGKASSTLFV
jgi:hypothetical protein